MRHVAWKGSSESYPNLVFNRASVPRRHFYPNYHRTCDSRYFARCPCTIPLLSANNLFERSYVVEAYHVQRRCLRTLLEAALCTTSSHIHSRTPAGPRIIIFKSALDACEPLTVICCVFWRRRFDVSSEISSTLIRARSFLLFT
jgi:hypothetical protein